MRMLLLSLILMAYAVLPPSLTAGSGRPPNAKPPPSMTAESHDLSLDHVYDSRDLNSSAPADTYLLAQYSFDIMGFPDRQGWKSVDLTTQPGTFFHVDTFRVISGAKSLWCGTPHSGNPMICTYATLPGYGNDWDQRFESAIPYHPVGELTVSFEVRYDSEPNYDFTYIEYSNDGGNHWRECGAYDGTGEGTVSHQVPPADSIMIRFNFQSDGAWSDEDGLYDSDGAIIIDNITVWDAEGLLDSQDFESEAIGDTATADGRWTARRGEAYGDFSGLFSGTTVLQQDPCARDISFVWGFFNGSTDYYSCTYPPPPDQPVVPFENERSQFIDNEIWSPWIEWNPGGTIPPTATAAVFDFWVYRHLPLSSRVFIRWHIRSKIGDDGCPGPWKDRKFVYYGSYPQWVHYAHSVGDLVQPGATHVQLALECVDYCSNMYCYDVPCHTHAPLFDTVSLYRIDTTGPIWSVRDIDLFQDNFPSDGTSSGTVRMDMARNRMPITSPTILPGDSIVVSVSEPHAGLGADPSHGGAAVYAYIRSTGGQEGSIMVDDPARFPLIGGPDAGGFYRFRMDTSYADAAMTTPVANQFCFDLDDERFSPPDRIDFYFSATDAVGNATYWSEETGPVASEAAVQDAHMEVQCLPTGSTDVLYVDDCDRSGAQIYFDSVFELMGLTVDRYDVRGSSSLVGNGPGARATEEQVVDVYRYILWDSGSLTRGTIGDGTGDPERSADAQLLYAFLNQTSAWNPGLYISGDAVANEMKTINRPVFQNLFYYINYTKVSATHTAAGIPLSPKVIEASTDSIFGEYVDPHWLPDSLIAYGGCPAINSFGVLQSAGLSKMGMVYENFPLYAAVVTQETPNPNGRTARVVLSGFSNHFIRDDRPQFPDDRAEHLQRILAWFGNTASAITGGGEAPKAVDRLSQNYPNPFNPETTIEFSIAANTRVALKIYTVAGRLVRTLIDEERVAGPHAVRWDGLDEKGQAAASAVYFCTIETKSFRDCKKLVLVK